MTRAVIERPPALRLIASTVSIGNECDYWYGKYRTVR
jgi:hypothetical protein